MTPSTRAYRFPFSEDPSELQDDTPIASGGLVDPSGIRWRVDRPDRRSCVRPEAHEMRAHHLDALDRVAGVVAHQPWR